jgi:hypothetical protein
MKINFVSGLMKIPSGSGSSSDSFSLCESIIIPPRAIKRNLSPGNILNFFSSIFNTSLLLLNFFFLHFF